MNMVMTGLRFATSFHTKFMFMYASHLQDGGDHASLQALLADMCNTMISPMGEQCIGVTVAPMDSGPLSGLACFKTGFKAGVSGNTIDVSNTGETCISPGGLLYLRNSGKLVPISELAL